MNKKTEGINPRAFYFTVIGSGGSTQIEFGDDNNAISGTQALLYRSSTYTENLSSGFLLSCGRTTTGPQIAVNLYKNGVLWRIDTSTTEVAFGLEFSTP